MKPEAQPRPINWQQYKRKGLSEMRPYVEGEDLFNVSISPVDKRNGSPKAGDMIARNPNNHADQWLVAQKYFEDNLELVPPTTDDREWTPQYVRQLLGTDASGITRIVDARNAALAAQADRFHKLLDQVGAKNWGIRDGKWLDEFGACKVCDGEIPDGHTNNCDIWKLEQQLGHLMQSNHGYKPEGCSACAAIKK
jgi:hypothetical protein